MRKKKVAVRTCWLEGWRPQRAATSPATFVMAAEPEIPPAIVYACSTEYAW